MDGEDNHQIDEDNYETDEDNDDYFSDDNNDDPHYDEELEEDKGDEDDIADEMEAIEARKVQEEKDCRFDNYEIMCDEAALREVDVVVPVNSSNPSTLLEVSQKGKGKEKRKNKGRGATKSLRVPSEPMHLEFDELNRPMGDWRLKYGQQAGLCMRKLNICWYWKDVNEGTKTLMWEDTKNLFNIPDTEVLRKKFRSLVAKRFRDFKSKLVSGWITKTRPRCAFEDGKEPPEIWKHIREEDWKLFQTIQTSSPAKRKREKAVKSAKKNEHHHHLGQNNFEAARKTWIKDDFYPKGSLSSSSIGDESASLITIDVNRADDWYCAMHSKDKKTGKYTIKKPKTKEVGKKYFEMRKKQTQGEFKPEGNKDALYYALGEKEDHPSRARGFGGVNVTVKEAFGDQIRNSGGSKKNRKALEDREALKNELRKELRNEMKLDLKSSLSSIFDQMGLPAFKLPDVTQMGAHRNEPNHVESFQPPLEIKNDTPCRLLLQDSHNGVLYEVARGKAFPGDVCHGVSVGPGNVRVKVSIVLEEFETLPLPVPVTAFDRNILTDAVGTFVQWPISLVRFEDEGDGKGNEGNRKEKGCAEVLGSNSHHSRLSTTPIKEPTREIMVESLSPDCQWLNTLIGLTADEETFNICFDANLFYYKEDGKIEVYKNDLKQFLEGSELSISIIQIFTRALRDDLVKLKVKPHIGWLCPDATADTKLRKKAEDAIAYITNAFQKSVLNGDEFILAPIIEGKHWVLLAICPKTYTIYEFDSITLTKGRKLYMSMVVLSALKRYKMSGGEIKVKRIEPLWKSVKCPQQSGSVECGYYVMRFMYDIVQSCSTASDLQKVWNSQREEPYTDIEINELRDKWAMYFTSRCVS